MSQIIKKAPEIKLNALKALCEIENYDKLIEELKMVIKSDKSKRSVCHLSNIIKGKKVLGHKNLKNFFIDYKEEIEIIKKYQCEETLILSNAKGDFYDYPSTEFFKYIRQNEDKMDNIIKLVDKMSELGIEWVTLFPEYKFDEEIHKVYTSPYYGLVPKEVVYLENVKIVPNYETDIMEYKTEGSNYYLPLKCDLIEKRIKEPYNLSIDVNNLFFDPNLLPDRIDYESTIGKIVALNSKAQKEKNILKNCVDMNIGIIDLVESLEEALKKCELDCDENFKKQLKNELYIIEKAIKNLQTIGKNVEDSLISNSNILTHEKIEDEKVLYLKKRWESNINMDW